VIDFLTFHSQEFQMKKQLQQGFTLIELMIVVAIIGILAAIAIPAYQDYTIRAQVSEGLSLMDGAKTAVAEYYTNTGKFPPSNASAGLATDTSISGKYVTKVDVGTGAGTTISATFGGPSANTAIGKTAVLSLSAVTAGGGAISWVCKSNSTIPQKYLPSTCKS
jgi:type IV pilus assembly protein PilA